VYMGSIIKNTENYRKHKTTNLFSVMVRLRDRFLVPKMFLVLGSFWYLVPLVFIVKCFAGHGLSDLS